MKLNISNIIKDAYYTVNENLILEYNEGKNFRRAIDFIEKNYPQFINKKITLLNGEIRTMSARDWVEQVRQDIPSVRLPLNKNGKSTGRFLLGATRLYFSFIKGNQNEIQGKISNFEKIIKLIIDGHIDEYDRNLNGLSYDELNQRFSSAIKKNLEKQENAVKNLKLKKDESYKIIEIPDFKTAKKYNKYTEWCVVKQEHMYDTYTKNGLGIFYFCLKDGFETVKKEAGKDAPLDEYGKSMFAISVNEDGSLNTCTCRWNHANGGNDNILKDAKEISEFFGVNFFEVFEPRDVEEILSKFKSKAIPSKIAKRHNGVETEDELIIAKDRRVKKYKKCYDKDNIKCFAYDKFYWFDTKTGEKIDPPTEVNGDFNCSNCKSLTSLVGAPEKVGRDFYCYRCESLTSLEGAPEKVGGDFNCSDCKSLTSLKGAPEKVGGNFNCYDCNALTSLEGAPEKVGGDFNCYRCESLTSLEGAPEKVSGDFNCSDCKSLTSLKGAPEKIDGDFNCYMCESLTSLVSASEIVKGNFNCSGCKKLTSLKGSPKEVGGDFNCSRCKSLTSLVGAPEKVGRDFYCLHCILLTTLKGAPRVLKRGNITILNTTRLTRNDVKKYENWLKTNPTENYLINTSIDESYVRYITSNFMRLF